MSTYETPSKSDFGAVMKLGLFVIVCGALLFFALHVAGVIGTAATAPGRVVNKTLGTDNIIASYEWFYDINAQFEARRGQIREYGRLVKAEADPKERSRLNIDLAAMRQSCRDMAAKYNANSEKVNKSVFKSGSLPTSLQLSDCEV